MSLGLSLRAAASRSVGCLVAVLALVLMSLSLTPAPARAQPQAVLDHIEPKSDRWAEVFVRSPAMGRVMQLDVLHPVAGTAPHPTLYLLDGDGATDQEAQSTWTRKSDIVQFFADKTVNVVMSVGGPGSFYTDWLRDDPKLGHNRWETFLTQELPPLLDRLLDGNGRNAIAGESMGAQAAATLAFRHPALYRAMAAYSGCLISDKLDQATVRSAVTIKGGDPDNMWGTRSDPEWAAHDPSKHIEELRGKQIYLSTASGVPGRADFTYDPTADYPEDTFNSIVLESLAHDCTTEFDADLRAHGVPATVRYTDFGTHSWPYWQAALHDSWPILAQGLDG
ncbi:alpha/beta hydrolase [Nocardia brasiliensis]|uniref:alpha/beta hydrolase n=1 Tax=Nocardia brasiliensis TaxID=37326 RepID=UPI0002F726F3|nr:alpha/beta hydrolase family protein [Nocardia brasiliensis]ASF08122.1 esterase family protein [Nocardia brasiliensis]SUB54225.1 Mycolyl transferase 85A [Nocardia brasiliensis]